LYPKINTSYLNNTHKNKKNFDLDDPKIYFSNLIKQKDRFDPKEVVFIKQILQRALPFYLRNQFTDILFKKYVKIDEFSLSKKLYLTYENIKEMTEGNMFFGSHGYLHDWLGDMNHEELKKELAKSDKFLSKITTKKHVKVMCYPNGNYNKQVINAIQKLNYKIGLTTQVGDANLNLSNAFSLKRWDTNDFPQ